MPIYPKRDLSALSNAPSQTERGSAAQTHNMIRDHLESDERLKKYSVDTFLQGSYKNSTNVRGDSDVDMGSLTNRIFYYDTTDLPSEPIQGGWTSLRKSVESSIDPASFTFQDYRQDVLKSLCQKFGTGNVIDGNKAITVKGNSYRLDADVLPCTAFRQYYQDWQGKATYHSGISFFTKQGIKVVNFPHQHFENLGQKDQSCNGKVKGSIRIMKRIRNELEEKGKWNRKRSPSYYLESLIWNVPSDKFVGGFDDVMQNVLAYLWNDLKEKKGTTQENSYTQANKVFYLFHSSFWNANDAFDFINMLWNESFESHT